VATRTTPKGSTAKRPPQRSSKLPLVLGGLAVVVLAVLIAYFTAQDQGVGFRGVDELAGSPIVTGDELPPFEGDTANDPALGQRPPVITGADFEGTTTTMGETGTPQLLMFLASWCPACQAELPEVVEWLEAGNLPAEVELTAVATGLDAGRPNWPPTSGSSARATTVASSSTMPRGPSRRPTGSPARRTGSPSTPRDGSSRASRA
jgi:thiol-disulfide isomerase/thioredoxin